MSITVNLASFIANGPPAPPNAAPPSVVPNAVVHSADWRTFVNSDAALPPVAQVAAQVRAEPVPPHPPSHPPEPPADHSQPQPDLARINEAAECAICHGVARLPLSICNICCNCTVCVACFIAYLQSEWSRLKNLSLGDMRREQYQRHLPSVHCPHCRRWFTVASIPSIDRRMETLCEALGEIVDPTESRAQMAMLDRAKDAYSDAIWSENFGNVFSRG
ncbi:RING-type domain-containing protein [Mycena chlorophos]|uniref:RING-type domain-containing protein n=1 Tax=Mycena chlorophos TaxID=658473 RepID=A0A8H6TJC6_MYCCL|nr:RING-type domain-containing protein [Mycena chlorophos]